MYKIAHIDENAAAINNFYQNFKTDFEILKIKVDANSTIDLIIQESFDNQVEAIVVDYMLDEEGDVNFNGNLIFDKIRKIRPHFPIVMLTSHEPQAIDHMEDVHIIYSKDILDGESEDELEIFKTKLKSNIERYYSKIQNTETNIEALVKKRNEQGLEPDEEEELTKLFILMDELEPEGKEIPVNLVQKESITKLNEFVSKTKEILAELKKENKR